MPTRPTATAAAAVAAAALAASAALAGARPLDLEFEDGVGGWRTVLDGVMGGLSTGRIAQPTPGVLRFTGELSLENNGGFSQIRRAVSGDDFAGAEGIEIRVKGDGRVYTFDIRTSNARMMAGAFQRTFLADTGDFTTVRLPFEDFRLYNFGRLVRDAPALDPSRIESIGVTLGDKKTGPFAIEIDAIRTYGGGTPSDVASTGSRDDLASVARAAGLTTLLDLVAAAELELPADEPVTIFAPTNEAFAALPDDVVAALLEPANRHRLRAILTYHVAGGAIPSPELLGRRTIDTLNGQRVPVAIGASLRVGDAGIVATDVPFAGGVVHVIDRVLVPEERTIADLAAANDDLATLAAAVAAAGLAEQLGAANDGPFTVFAPVNAAFDALPDGVLASLLEEGNRRDLVEILGLHLVPGRLHANELLASGSARTFFGTPIDFTLEGSALRAGGARIVAADVPAANGVVHLIDTVILPADDAPPSETADDPGFSAIASANAALVYELAIDRGVPLFNDGQVGACAAVYEIAIASMIALGRDDLGARVIDRLERGLRDARRDPDARERAWTYRGALDDAYTMLLVQAEAAIMTSRDS